jgi:hypothetical protein
MIRSTAWSSSSQAQIRGSCFTKLILLAACDDYGPPTLFPPQLRRRQQSAGACNLIWTVNGGAALISHRMVPLSVLDLASITEGGDAALTNTVFGRIVLGLA